MIDYLKTVDTPTLSNAIELLAVRPRAQGFAPLGLRCLFPEMGRLAGYAVTAQVETVTRPDQRDFGVFLELYRAVEASPEPAVVAFQEIGGAPDLAAHAGEVMCTFFKRLGAVGLVSDCGVRDLPEVRAMGFQYFARGSVASHANFRIVRVGVPITLLGLEIDPGDILHGDENGLITVPREKIDELPAKVEEIRSSERKILDFVRGPNFSLDRLASGTLE